MRTVCVIPARHGSTRLHAKALREINGRPMIAWVCDVAKGAPEVDEVLVATDHEEIAAVARACGVEPVMTDPALPSGTDRVHAAVAGRAADIVVNLQGDEPTMPSEAISAAHRALLADPGADISTVCVPIPSAEDFENPMVVKVVRDARMRSLYFSRSPIPSLPRRPEDWRAGGVPYGQKHLGLYLYRRAALERFVALPPCLLERYESLEQLRALDAGMSIVCVESPRDSVSVDVEDDLRKASEALSRR
ncbi:MAG: 3-deoxy-manno-octulosonate cytidylyltransferase [Candidatus Sumerlaeia bacterium]|nr:3-deoxy-manno-octulosonate cytidylyltransferase [Candidatus Sumerlaeia bacterium]